MALSRNQAGQHNGDNCGTEGNPTKLRNLFFLIFAASGFAGLIYESIWTHYLKLFLGHAAYAQTLVLAIFMGGMALGAWLCSRYSMRWHKLLLAYAVVEGIIGVLALIFHPLFDGFMQLAYTSLIPSLPSPSTVNIFKWSAASLFILPQSVLLGMTFPLMTAGIIRRFPENPGGAVSMLYFTNSIGAAIGVLASGFLFISWVGLPGTIRIAGLINIVLAVLVWMMVRNDQDNLADTGRPQPQPEMATDFRLLLLLFVAFVTGMASFMYEIGWIRMLSLVLGSTTHGFELMLSAFITGLAFGGLVIKRYIDRLQHPIRFLAFVQLIMGALALLTLPLYGNTFDVMQWLILNLDKTHDGYVLFTLSSHVIALSIMLPTTFMAGMTLPLITYVLLRRGYGEKSIGAVYASNTVGAIAGVFIAVHLAMPELGLKGLICLGAAMDIALGLGLAWWVFPAKRLPSMLTAGSVGMLLLVMVTVQLDPFKMSSGVYRNGKFLTPSNHEILYQQDGKAATVTVGKDIGGEFTGFVQIATNGKVDAGINMDDANQHGPDEATMALIGALPLLLHPEARVAANIGMGSGMTTHVMMSSPQLDRLDTIEIEPAMVAGAQFFRPRVGLAFEDPRSHIHIEDAKTFFSGNRQKYDIIISEPSNPWVSGVASLFSEEFYRHVKRAMNKDALFVQWLQLYEIDLNLVASVIKALSAHFVDYDIYASNDTDIVIIAKADGSVPRLPTDIKMDGGLAHELKLVTVRGIQDLLIRWIGNKAVLNPLFDSYAIEANSDYFPVLDLNAGRTRFLGQDASSLVAMAFAEIPAIEMLAGRTTDSSSSIPSLTRHLTKSVNTNLAAALNHYLLTGKSQRENLGSEMADNIHSNTNLSRRVFLQCNMPIPRHVWLGALYRDIAKRVLPYLAPDELDAFWSRLESDVCWPQIPPFIKDNIRLLQAVSHRNGPLMAQTARKLLASSQGLPQGFISYYLSSGTLGHLASGDKLAAKQLWQEYEGEMGPKSSWPLVAHLLASHSQ